MNNICLFIKVVLFFFCIGRAQITYPKKVLCPISCGMLKLTGMRRHLCWQQRLTAEHVYRLLTAPLHSPCCSAPLSAELLLQSGSGSKNSIARSYFRLWSCRCVSVGKLKVKYSTCTEEEGSWVCKHQQPPPDLCRSNCPVVLLIFLFPSSYFVSWVLESSVWGKYIWLLLCNDLTVVGVPGFYMSSLFTLLTF